jgi:Zn-dependent protease with chaperone function
MPILLVLALTAACVPVRWSAPLFGGGKEVAITFTASAVFLSLLTAFLVRGWVVRTLRREPLRKGEVAGVYARVRRLMFFVNVGMVALSIIVFGWGWFIRTTLVLHGQLDPDGEPLLAPFAELVIPLPYFIILFGAWTIYYDAERALLRTTTHGPVNKPFWTRTGYFFHHLRQFLLLVMLPVGLIVIQQTVARFAFETTQTKWYRFGTLALIPPMILFLPLLIKPLLGLQSMPAGPTRDRLEALAKRLHFRCSDFLLWHTHGAAANAMIVGLIPRVRYVIFTDRLLEDLSPEEVDAVFGHEVGHAKHGHILLYALFFVLSMTVLAAVLLLLEQRINNEYRTTGKHPPEWVKDWIALPPILLIAGYIFFVFGFLSRRCERQADVYGCRAVSCDNPNCTRHDDRTNYPEQAKGLCATGIRTFVRALERVGHINGHIADDEERSVVGSWLKGLFAWLKSWQHSTMPSRVSFLMSLIGHPEKERRFQRTVLVLRWLLMLALAAALYSLGEVVGWEELSQVL